MTLSQICVVLAHSHQYHKPGVVVAADVLLVFNNNLLVMVDHAPVVRYTF